MENIGELKELLATPKAILLTTHRNPDGDAMGSSLALYNFFVRRGHTVNVLVPSEYPDFLEWMPNIEKVLIHDLEPETGKRRIEEADLIFALDYNGLDRVDKMGELIGKQSNTKKVMIDHHLYPDDFADFVMSDTTASSTCEMIYDFLYLMGEQDGIDPVVGECIFTGILTDTGSFKHATSAKLFRIVAELLERGVDDYLLQDLIFNTMKAKNLKLLGHCLYNRMEILPEYQTGIIYLTKEDYENYDIKRGDTEGIVNYLLRLRNVKVAAFIHEQPKITKISLRSKGDISVQEIAKMHFKGGGHKNAAGGASFIGLENTIKKFKSLLPGIRALANPS